MALELTYILTTTYSFILSLIIFLVVAPALLPRLFKPYQFLPRVKQFIVKDAFLSFCLATTVGLRAWYIYIFAADQIPHDVIWHDSPLVRHTLAIYTGYVTAALVLMLTHNIGQMSSKLHHFFSTYTGFVAMTYPCLMYCANNVLMMELSNPFVNMRMMLKVVGYEKTTAYVWNGLAMLVTFFIARCVSTTIGTLRFLHLALAHPQFWDLPLCIHVCYFGGVSIFNVLNYYWFYKICRGVLKYTAELKTTKEN
ncbi:TLC domain-containing protein 4-B-like [Branchiostoma floridae x Branchiostoma japonicum]